MYTLKLALNKRMRLTINKLSMAKEICKLAGVSILMRLYNYNENEKKIT